MTHSAWEEESGVAGWLARPRRPLVRIVAHSAAHPRVNTTSALSALVHGYVGQPDLARSVNIYHVQVVALRSMSRNEWVPSAATTGDIPTRASRKHEMSPSATFKSMVLPPMKEVEARG